MKQIAFEHQKTKGRHLFLTSLIFLGILLVWNIVTFNEKSIPTGFIGQLYNMTLMNSLIFPTFTAVIASRIVDVEHKGNTWKLLETLQSKRTIYLGKVCYGLIYVTAIVFLEMILLLLTGFLMSFGDSPDMWAYALFFVSNLSVCTVLYLLQMLLSLCFSNQAVSLCCGICGSMAGLFLLFIPGGLLHKLLPWGEFGAVNFVYMDWNEATRDISYYYSFPAIDIIFFILFWLLLLLVGGYRLYLKMDNDGFTLSPVLQKRTRHKPLAVTRLPSELIKIKRTPIWLAFLVLPSISAVIGTFNYKMNTDILKDGWYDMWSQHSLFFCFFFFAPLIGVYASYLWKLEHTGTNWNMLLTLKAPWRIVSDKLLVCTAVSTLTLLWLCLLYILGGLSAGLTLDTLPSELKEWLICGILGSIGICSAQCFLSLIMKSFSLPIGLSLIGSIIGLLLSTKGWYYLLPYSNFCIGMRANNPFAVLPLARFITSLIFFTLFFYFLSIFYIRKFEK